MPVWLLSALGLLRASLSRPGALVVAGAGAGQVAGSLIDFPGGDDGGRPRRRRRRPALTASDQRDIAFAAAFLSKAAMEKFVVVLATRT